MRIFSKKLKEQNWQRFTQPTKTVGGWIVRTVAAEITREVLRAVELWLQT
ncbi:hypothetical protein [Streptomyces scopuliridis]